MSPGGGRALKSPHVRAYNCCAFEGPAPVIKPLESEKVQIKQFSWEWDERRVRSICIIIMVTTNTITEQDRHTHQVGSESVIVTVEWCKWIQQQLVKMQSNRVIKDQQELTFLQKWLRIERSNECWLTGKVAWRLSLTESRERLSHKHKVTRRRQDSKVFSSRPLLTVTV